jgi:hypothetical protein
MHATCRRFDRPGDARHYQFVAENYLNLARGELELAAAQKAVGKPSDL